MNKSERVRFIISHLEKLYPKTPVPLNNQNNYEFDVWGAMHTSVDIIDECIKMIKENFNGPIFAYPDSGGWLSPNWTFDNVINPKNFIEKVKVWHALGAQIVGGCCGTSPDHIKAISSIK